MKPFENEKTVEEQLAYIRGAIYAAKMVNKYKDDPILERFIKGMQSIHNDYKKQYDRLCQERDEKLAKLSA